jgi:hypothetical protein
MSERSQIYPKIDNNDNQELTRELEEQFTTIIQTLYTTSVPASVLENKVMPYIAHDVVFMDPFQEGRDKNSYRVAMKGWCLFFNY